MSITISPARIEQVTKTVTVFTHMFASPPSESTTEQLTAVLHPEIHWYDHGFYNLRIGHSAVLSLQKGFLHCNQPFQCEIKSIIPTAEGAVAQQIWRGVCKNDIVRPDGSVIMKGSGRAFVTNVCFVMGIDEEGRIVRIDEYDHRYWDEGVGEEEYKVMRGESLKKGL